MSSDIPVRPRVHQAQQQQPQQAVYNDDNDPPVKSQATEGFFTAHKTALIIFSVIIAIIIAIIGVAYYYNISNRRPRVHFDPREYHEPPPRRRDAQQAQPAPQQPAPQQSAQQTTTKPQETKPEPAEEVIPAKTEELDAFIGEAGGISADKMEKTE